MIKDWLPAIIIVVLVIMIFVVLTTGDDIKEGSIIYDRYVVIKIYDDGDAYLAYDSETRVMYDIIKYDRGIGITPHYVGAKEVGIWR